MDKNCDWISALPDEILVIILDKLHSKTAVSTSLLGQRWRHLWRFLQSFDFSEVSLPGNYIRVQLGPMREKYFNANKVHHFIESLRWFTRIERDTALRKLSTVFSGSSECTDAVNSAIASATEHGVKEIDVAIVGYTEYEFPSWLFSGQRSSLLTSLFLSYCKLSGPLNFAVFSSLTKLVLITMHMSLKEAQVLLRNCTNLQSLHLIGQSSIRILQLPKLKELILFWSTPCGTFKIDTPALQRMEYVGEVLPKSTFQSLPCLEHVSLRSFCDDHPDCHADKLQNISTRFPRLKSLHLQYDVPKVSK